MITHRLLPRLGSVLIVKSDWVRSQVCCCVSVGYRSVRFRLIIQCVCAPPNYTYKWILTRLSDIFCSQICFSVAYVGDYFSLKLLQWRKLIHTTTLSPKNSGVQYATSNKSITSVLILFFPCSSVSACRWHYQTHERIIKVCFMCMCTIRLVVNFANLICLCFFAKLQLLC